MVAETTEVREHVLEDALAAAGFAGARQGAPHAGELARILAEVPLFASLRKRELRHLAGQATVRRYRAGQRIARAGFSAEGFFVLLTGRAHVERDGRLVAELGRGGFFGELGLLDGQARQATVVADCDLWALRLPRQAFLEVVRCQPDVTLALLRELCRRMRELHLAD